MIRPSAIVQFERLYWLSFALSLIAKALAWPTQRARMDASAELANLPWILPLTIVIGIAVAVLLWYYTVRRPSIVAKWIVVVFAAIGGLGIAFSLVLLLLGRITELAPTIISLLANVVYIGAAVLLFKPDAKAWFGEESSGGEPPLA